MPFLTCRPNNKDTKRHKDTKKQKDIDPRTQKDIDPLRFGKIFLKNKWYERSGINFQKKVDTKRETKK